VVPGFCGGGSAERRLEVKVGITQSRKVVRIPKTVQAFVCRRRGRDYLPATLCEGGRMGQSTGRFNEIQYRGTECGIALRGGEEGIKFCGDKEQREKKGPCLKRRTLTGPEKRGGLKKGGFGGACIRSPLAIS